MNYELSHNKLGEHEREKVFRVLETLKNDSFNFRVEDTPDILYIIFPPQSEGESEKKIGFTKVGDTMTVNGFIHPQHFSDVIEATIRYPNISLTESIPTLKKYREEKELQNK